MKAVTAGGFLSRRATAPVTSAVAATAPAMRSPDGRAGAAPTGTRRADGDGRAAPSAAAGTDTASAPDSVSAAVSTRPAPDRQGGRSALAMRPRYGAFCMLPPVGKRERLRSVIRLA